jgi:hypothetical protein
MKQLPTVIASTKRGVAIELIDFEATVQHFDTDTTRFYFSLREAPKGSKSRVGVAFLPEHFVLAKPERYGDPALTTQAAVLRMLAEATLGDQLDTHGLPFVTIGSDPVPVVLGEVEPFTPQLPAWKTRVAASDDDMTRYIGAHLYAAWRYGHPRWILGPSDLARLKLPHDEVMRIVKLYEGNRWAVSVQSPTLVALSPLPPFLREMNGVPPSAVVLPTFVSPNRIDELRRLSSPKLDTRRLIEHCEALNTNFAAGHLATVSGITRTILDHVPPAFGVNTFQEVANNVGGKSFKKSMQRLQGAARDIADHNLHARMQKSDALPNEVQVDFKQELDQLLEQVVIRLS